MGQLSDSFRARLDEMRERHAQTDREIAAARADLYARLAEMQAITKELENC